MDQIKVVSFDVGGTLVDNIGYFDFVWNTAIPQLYARKVGISLEQARDYVMGEYALVGDQDVRWYLPEYWFGRLKLDGDPTELFRSFRYKLRVYSEVPGVLKNLSKGYDLIIASVTLIHILEIEVENLRHNFKRVFSSTSELGQVGKSSFFYKRICETLGVKPSALVHVGDDWNSDFLAPRKIGIQAFHLNRTAEQSKNFTIKDLKDLEKRLS